MIVRKALSLVPAFIFTVCLTLQFPAAGIAQDNGIAFDRVSSRKNLTHNSIRTIYQDKTGFLWIGSKTGLDLYNGSFFVSYKNDNSSKSLSDNIVTAILEDAQGDFWIGTYAGLNKFIKAENRFLRYLNKPDDPSTICGSTIVDILQDKEGFLWIATTKGLSRYDKQKNRFSNFRHEDGNPKTIQSDSLNALFLDPRGYLWAGYSDQGLDRIQPFPGPEGADSPGLSIAHFNLAAAPPAGNAKIINKITQTRDGRFWLGTEGAGILLFKTYPDAGQKLENGQSVSLTGFQSLNTDCSGPRLTNNFVKDIIEDGGGGIWIATFGGGVNILRPDNSIISCTYDPYAADSLGNNSIQKLYEDNSGNIWVGPLTGGLNRHAPRSRNFTIYRSDAAHGNLKSDLVTAIYQDSDNILWLGTRNGLNRFDKAGNSCEVFYHDPGNLYTTAEKVIRSVYEDKYQKIWLGTAKGLFCFDKKTKLFVHYNEALRQLVDTAMVRAVYCDEWGILWVGSNRGLIRYDQALSDLRIYNHDAAKSATIVHDYIWGIYADKHGNLWIGTRNGLSRYIRDKDTFVSYQFRKELESTDRAAYNSFNLITSICEDMKGEIWTDSYGGMNRLIRTGKPLSEPDAYKIADFSLSTIDGQSVSGVMADQEDNLWVGSDIGIMKIRPARDKLRLYDVSDGATANEMNSGSFFKSKSGEFYYGGNNGMLEFTPGRFSENSRVPNIVLTSFKLFDDFRYTGVQASEVKQIDLSYDDYVLTFSFAALDYTAPEKNHYKYMLQGFDRGWKDAATKTEATYMNLRGGVYYFRVVGSNNDQIWNEDGLTVKIVVVPPIWERTWFQVLALLLVGGGVYTQFRWRIHRIEKQKELLKKEVEHGTEDLRQTNLRLEEEIQVRKAAEENIRKTNLLLTESNATKDKLFSIISHDLKGPVGSIVSMLKMLGEEKGLDADTLRTLGNMTDAAHGTYVMLENLLDWARTQRGGINLKIQKQQLSLMIDEVVHSLAGPIAKKSTNILPEVDDKLFVLCDRSTILTVLRNLTSNAIKFTVEKGMVRISADRRERDVVITVRDNGVGIEADVLKEMFEKVKVVSTYGTEGEKGTGLGLILCMEFVRKNGGEIWAESTPDEGTAIHFSLPAYLQRTNDE
jgi:ligand-binding sensor domain-containing protein/signal transduction histidine kinase